MRKIDRATIKALKLTTLEAYIADREALYK